MRKKLEMIDFDLLIMLGDYAYEIYDDNGKNGEKYFEKME